MVSPTNGHDVDTAKLAAALAGDEAAFSDLTERHRRELQVHCYRMVGSFNDSEDLVQETLLRAWRGRETFQGRSPLRAWLYGIATNVCLDFLAKNQHRVLVREGDPPRADPEPSPEVAWLQPYPDRLLEPVSPREAEPDKVVTGKETIGIAFLVAMQFLPVKQRAALILCDVLDWSAKETADLLAVSVASVNSALQRARDTLRKQQPALKPEWKPGLDPDEQQRTLLERYVTATERGDAAGAGGAAFGRRTFLDAPRTRHLRRARHRGLGLGEGRLRLRLVRGLPVLLTRANRMPAVACYLRRPGADSFRAMAVDVLQIEDGLIKEITTFPLESMIRAFGLPPELT